VLNTNLQKLNTGSTLDKLMSSHHRCRSVERTSTQIARLPLNHSVSVPRVTSPQRTVYRMRWALWSIESWRSTQCAACLKSWRNEKMAYNIGRVAPFVISFFSCSSATYVQSQISDILLRCDVSFSGRQARKHADQHGGLARTCATFLPCLSCCLSAW